MEMIREVKGILQKLHTAKHFPVHPKIFVMHFHLIPSLRGKFNISVYALHPSSQMSKFLRYLFR